MFNASNILGMEGNYKLSSYILEYLVELSFITFAHIKRPPLVHDNNSYWMTTKYLGLESCWVEEWNYYISCIKYIGYTLNNSTNKLISSPNSLTGTISVMFAYNVISKEHTYIVPIWWYKKIWSWHIHLKLKCFFSIFLKIVWRLGTISYLEVGSV